jgi:predicted RNase H-like nuclease (RuvC/YqgF family)
MHENNYIARLRREVAEAKAEVEALKKQMADARELISDFRGHLTSSKFHEDTTIQIRDVENRLLDITRGLV